MYYIFNSKKFETKTKMESIESEDLMIENGRHIVDVSILASMIPIVSYVSLMVYETQFKLLQSLSLTQFNMVR